jgi:hypothetical protein
VLLLTPSVSGGFCCSFCGSPYHQHHHVWCSGGRASGLGPAPASPQSLSSKNRRHLRVCAPSLCTYGSTHIPQGEFCGCSGVRLLCSTLCCIDGGTMRIGVAVQQYSLYRMIWWQYSKGWGCSTAVQFVQNALVAVQ